MYDSQGQLVAFAIAGSANRSLNHGSFTTYVADQSEGEDASNNHDQKAKRRATAGGRSWFFACVFGLALAGYARKFDCFSELCAEPAIAKAARKAYE